MTDKNMKPKREPIVWPNTDDAKPHVKNWFRSLSSKKLKGEAREKKMRAMWDEVTR